MDLFIFLFFLTLARICLELVQLALEENKESALGRLNLILFEEVRVQKVANLLVRRDLFFVW